MDKRTDYISWDEYFMGVAHLAALRSKDPNTQVGCCIVSEDNKILSIGYNGFPKGCSDDEFPWRREGIRTIPSIFIQRTANSMQSSITGEAAWREQSFMFRSFRATSVPKRSFSAGSEP